MRNTQVKEFYNVEQLNKFLEVFKVISVTPLLNDVGPIYVVHYYL